MTQRLLLEGEVDDRDQTIALLRRQNMQLDEALRLERIKSAALEAGGKEVRSLLAPLYRSLRMLFNEFDGMGVGETAAVNSNDPKWEFWRKRFPGRGAELIDLLLIQKAMNTKDLSIALKCDPRTLAQLIFKMKPILIKNGNMFSLKDA